MKKCLEKKISLGLALGLAVVMGVGCAADCKRRKGVEPEPIVAVVVAPPKVEPAPSAQVQMQAQEDELSKYVEVTKAPGGLLVHLSNDILFKPGKSVLGPVGIKEIGKLGTVLARFPKNKIHVTGHTDSTGKSALNQILSLKRAEAVKDILVKNGVQESIGSVEGLGDTQPVADNSTPEGQAGNRRVELLITN